ncbi:hypothetical protein DL770_010613 [Monosporascus sp. CRB-9-2]|nr:hypothetical protein DL770_010613 [Monosporascus sp. CRB-9-2]
MDTPQRTYYGHYGHRDSFKWIDVHNQMGRVDGLRAKVAQSRGHAVDRVALLSTLNIIHSIKEVRVPGVADNEASELTGSAGKHRYTEAEKKALLNSPVDFLQYRKNVDQILQRWFSIFLRNSPERDMAPGEGFIEAITQKHVTVIKDEIETFTEDGIMTKDGRRFPLDLIVCATGFDVAYAPHLHETQVDYTIQACQKISSERLHSIVPRVEPTRQYMEFPAAWHKEFNTAFAAMGGLRNYETGGSEGGNMGAFLGLGKTQLKLEAERGLEVDLSPFIRLNDNETYTIA